MNLGQAAKLIALGEIGNGEGTRNNHGFHINKYRRGRKPFGSGAWCATFVCYCLEEAWCALGKKMKHFPIVRTNSANKLATRLERYGKLVTFNKMQPGDILLFDRHGGKHINIVNEVITDGENVLSYTTLDGNKGPFPAVVDVFSHGLYPKPLKVIRLP